MLSVYESNFSENERIKRELKKFFEDLGDNLEKYYSDELDLIMEKVLARAIELCPKDTGKLASSINLEEGGSISRGDFYGKSIYAGREDIINPKTKKPTSEYALFVHDGTISQEPKPFLEDALAEYEDELEETLKRAVDRAVKEYQQATGTGEAQ